MADMDYLPIFVRLAGQRVLLRGCGEAAAAKARLITAAGGIIVDEIEPGVRLAFVALDDGLEAATMADELKAAGLLVNVVDRPALCDFTIPAIVDRSPVILAVGTGGASATLAKALRERLEALLPAGLGPLAQAIRDARKAIATRYTDSAARRRFWDAALAPGGAIDPLCDHQDPTATVAAVLNDNRDVVVASTLHEMIMVSTDPDDLTLRQLRCLAQADTVYHTSSTAKTVLDRARRDAVRVIGHPPEILPPGRSVWLR